MGKRMGGSAVVVIVLVVGDMRYESVSSFILSLPIADSALRVGFQRVFLFKGAARSPAPPNGWAMDFGFPLVFHFSSQSYHFL